MRECSYDQRVAHKWRGTDNKDILEKQKKKTVENETIPEKKSQDREAEVEKEETQER